MMEEGETAANSPEGDEVVSNGEDKVGREMGRAEMPAGAAAA
jgi:hypothetical protein